MLRRRIRLSLAGVTGLRVLGLGYATPYLRPFLAEAERVVAMMPAAQGVLPWPGEGPNRVALADEGELPLADYSIDRVLLVHGVEFSEQVRPHAASEVWRVLGGRRAAARRRAQSARHLGAARQHALRPGPCPIRTGQLSRLLREEGFTPERNDRGALRAADRARA